MTGRSAFVVRSTTVTCTGPGANHLCSTGTSSTTWRTGPVETAASARSRTPVPCPPPSLPGRRAAATASATAVATTSAKRRLGMRGRGGGAGPMTISRLASARARSRPPGAVTPARNPRTTSSSSMESLLRETRQLCRDRRAHERARPVQSRLDGSDRKLERVGDLLVRQLAPRKEQQHLAIAEGEAGEHSGEHRLERRRRRIGRRLRPRRIGGSAGEGAELPLLGTRVRTEEVGGDSVQPWPRVGPRKVVRSAPREGGREDLGGELVGERLAQASPKVPADDLEVPLEDRDEGSRLVERGRDR